MDMLSRLMIKKALDRAQGLRPTDTHEMHCKRLNEVLLTDDFEPPYARMRFQGMETWLLTEFESNCDMMKSSRGIN